MGKIKQYIENWQARLRGYFVDTDKVASKRDITVKKWFNLVLVVAGLVAIVIITLLFLASNNRPKKDASQDYGLGQDSEDNNSLKEHPEQQQIILATDAVSADSKWHNFLEESIETEGKTREQQIELLKNSVTKSQEASKEEINLELNELKARLSYALNEIDRLKVDNQNIQQDIATFGSNGVDKAAAELGITAINNKLSTRAPVSSFNYIPATSYVSGHLLGGIVVSTSVNSAAEPIPVIIKLTSRGNLPKDFAVEVKQCRLLASCYGDISSERAIIRAEELVCEDKEAGLIISTKVSGVIYGDDGANGIRGAVVSMSDKHLKNAVVGGVLSGLSNTAKGQNRLDITSLGMVSSQKKGMQDLAQEGVLSGASSAAEKLADYHIRLAENISPVILIPGGTKVDVVFTKSVEIGSTDIEEVIRSERAGR